MDTTALAERLLEACRTPDGSELPDHAEPWGADVATLREAATRLRAVAGEPAWPSEAKRADDGDGWAAISLGVLHRMSADQARVWNGCRAACIASYTRPQPATPATVTDEDVAWPSGVLNREATIRTLTEHNAWRRGARGPQTDPMMLGKALDAAIAALESFANKERE